MRNVPQNHYSSINSFVSNKEIPLSKILDTDEVSNYDLSSKNTKYQDHANGLDESKYRLELKRIKEFLGLYRGLKETGFIGTMKPEIIKWWMMKELECLVKIGNHKPYKHPFSYEEYCYLTDQRLKNKYNKILKEGVWFGEEKNKPEEW